MRNWRQRWEHWHTASGWRRWPVKVGFVLLTTVLVLYPRFWLLPTWITRLADIDAMIDPHHPGLVPLEQAVLADLDGDPRAAAAVRAVGRVVASQIPYAWDWDVWGVMDYLPTTGEALAAGREDCDGRAVVAAALLRRLGHDAWLVTDITHVWVETGAGPLMRPGKNPPAIVGGAEGTRVSSARQSAGNLFDALIFGIQVFPLTRELLLLLAILAATAHPRCSTIRAGVACAIAILGLGLMRDAGAAAYALGQHPGLFVTGLALTGAGWLLLAFKAGGRRFVSAPPG